MYQDNGEILKRKKMDSNLSSTELKIFQKSVEIHAPASRVWQALTIPASMNQWMMPDMDLEIRTDWEVGGPLVMRGTMNGKDFGNKGTVLKYEPEKHLQYSHLSSISRLPNRPESYSMIGFELQPERERTILTLTLRGGRQNISLHSTGLSLVATTCFFQE
jgi:uncharacterized protein YndB with AHSA1/START domain